MHHAGLHTTFTFLIPVSKLNHLKADRFGLPKKKEGKQFCWTFLKITVVNLIHSLEADKDYKQLLTAKNVQRIEASKKLQVPILDIAFNMVK